MIPVLQDHFFCIDDSLFFPFLAADVLPSRDLGKYKQTEFVTGIQEGMALRIMGCSDGIYMKLFLQDPGVLFLKRIRNGITDIGIALMAVQSIDKAAFAIQQEIVFPVFQSAEAETHIFLIDHFAVSHKLDSAGV